MIADFKAGPLAHLPFASFAVNGAWLLLAAMAFDLIRGAAGSFASAHHEATTATVAARPRRL